jgi:hypothetical protein
MRGATGLMDVVFRVNDADDATVKTRALAFIDGQRSFAKVIKPTTFAEGTGAKLGDAIAANTDHTLTWNVAADWNISLGQIKFEILAMDGRGLLPLDWVTIPAANGQPELTISKNAPTDQEVLEALFWQYASGDPGLVVEDGFLVGTAASGALDGVDLVSGTTVEAYASTWVMKSMNLALADIAQVNYAIEARSGVTNNSRWHALKAPYQPIDVVVGWNPARYDYVSETWIRPRVKSRIPVGLPHIRSISNGYPTLVLRENGTVFSFGAPFAPPTDLNNVTAIAAGHYFGIALKSDGTVVAWGDNDFGQTNVPAGLANVTAIAAGYNHSLALKSDGTVAAWGSNEHGQTTVPAGLSGVVSITTDDYVSLAVKDDGTVVGWGRINVDSFSQFQDIKQMSANRAGCFIGLKSDGTVMLAGCWSGDGVSPPFGLNAVTFVDGEGNGGYALKTDGAVIGWGDDFGDLILAPDNLRGVSALDVRYGLALALKKAPRQP